MVELPKSIEEHGFKRMKTVEEVERTAANNLAIMKKQAEMLCEDYVIYCKCDDVRLQDSLLESMTSRINHVAQAFRDIMAFIEINESGSGYEESLSYYVRQYEKRGIVKSQKEMEAVNFLRRRNSIIHDYFNSAYLNNEVLKAVANFGRGFVEISDSLKDYCHKNFPELQLENDIRAMKKQGKTR